MELTVVKYPDPILKARTVAVSTFGPSLAELAEGMRAAMRAHKGVGLAAPQVGWTTRLFVMCPGEGDEHFRICANPRVSAEEGRESGEEGCLSIPGVVAQVERAARLDVEYQDAAGTWKRESLEGLAARVFQHEFDHLDGILILDRMSPSERMAARRALRDLEEEARPPVVPRTL